MPTLGAFVLTLAIGLVVNFLLAQQQYDNGVYAKYTYQLVHATQLSRTQSQSALKGNNEALKHLQNATEEGIFSVNTLKNGNLKLSVSAAPTDIQSTLQDFSPLWKKISSLNSSILQSRSQIQSLSDKKESIQTSLDKLVELQKSVIEALLLNDATDEQLQVAIDQLGNLYQFQSGWQSLINQGNFDLRSIETWQMQFSQSQHALLSGRSSPPLAAIKDPQVRRLIANVSTQFESMTAWLNELYSADKEVQSLKQQIDDLNKLEHTIDQQLALLVSTADQLNSHGLIKNWYIYLIFLVLGGLYLLSVYSLGSYFPSSDALLMDGPSPVGTATETSASSETTNTVSNRRKAANNQLINEIRPLGEGKLYFDVTDSNEHTREIAEAYNQAKARLIQRCVRAKKESEEAQTAIRQQLQIAQSELTNEIKLVSQFKESIPLLLAQLNHVEADVTDLKPTLELANKIRARLSLTKEKLHKLSRTEPNSISEKTFKALQEHLISLVSALSDAELEQEQINIYLQDHCKKSASDGSIEGELKDAIQAFNPLLSEISVKLNSLESNLIDTNKLMDKSFKQLSILELDRGLK